MLSQVLPHIYIIIILILRNTDTLWMSEIQVPALQAENLETIFFPLQEIGDMVKKMNLFNKNTGCYKWKRRARGEKPESKEMHVSTKWKEVENFPQRGDVWVDLEGDRRSLRREEGKGHLGREISESRFIEVRNRTELSELSWMLSTPRAQVLTL